MTLFFILGGLLFLWTFWPDDDPPTVGTVFKLSDTPTRNPYDEWGGYYSPIPDDLPDESNELGQKMLKERRQK